MVRISQPDKSLLLVISWTKSSSDQCAYMNICKCTQSSGFVVENFFEKICSQIVIILLRMVAWDDPVGRLDTQRVVRASTGSAGDPGKRIMF